MKLFIRSVSIIFMFFILRAISGCFNHDCPDDVYPFDFSKIKICCFPSHLFKNVNLLSFKDFTKFFRSKSFCFYFSIFAIKHNIGSYNQAWF